jgi:gas vesicle protein
MTSANDPDRLQKVYMTINVECDGPDPALNNLLELSCVLHFENGIIIDELNIKFIPLPNRKPDQFTMINFWNVNPEAWAWVNTDAVDVDSGMSSFIDFFERYSKLYSIRFVGDPASRDFVWLQEYYTNYAMFSTMKLFPYCRCLTTMRKSYQKMLNLTDDQSWSLKNNMQNSGEEILSNRSHIGIERARKQAREFCLLRQKMYTFQSDIQIQNDRYIISQLSDMIKSIKEEIKEEIQNMISKNEEFKEEIQNMISKNEEFKENIINTIKNELKSDIHISGTTKIIKQFSPLF